MRFVQVLEGADGQSAKPVVASADARLVTAVTFLLARRLGLRSTLRHVEEAFSIIDGEAVSDGGARQ